MTEAANLRISFEEVWDWSNLEVSIITRYMLPAYSGLEVLFY